MMARDADELTRLAFAEVVRYRRIIERLRDEENYRKMSYEPARQIIEAYHSSDGDVSLLEEGIAELRFQEMHADEESEGTVAPRNNAEVLETYLAAFAIPFRPLVPAPPGEPETYLLDIHGMVITGKHHFAVTNALGNTKYLYLLTSKGWTEEEKSFFISLLGDIIASNVPGASPRHVEGLDCRTGRKVIRAGLGPNYRRRLEFIVEDLQRLGLD